MTNNQSSQSPGSPALRTQALTFRWAPDQALLSFPDIDLPQGDHLFLRGPSGSGKSTLLSLICGLSPLQQGRLELLGENVGHCSRGQLDRLRANRLGVIFQQFNLVPYLDPLANVLLPCRLSSQRRSRTSPSAPEEARSLLSALAIPESHWSRGISELSVGQQQRVAAARALIGAPSLILADEPTSALDSDNRDRFLDVLLGLANQRQTSVLFVSHDESLARHFHRQLSLGDVS